MPVRFIQIEDIELGAPCFLLDRRRVGREPLHQPPNGVPCFTVTRARTAGARAGSDAPTPGTGGGGGAGR